MLSIFFPAMRRCTSAGSAGWGIELAYDEKAAENADHRYRIVRTGDANRRTAPLSCENVAIQGAAFNELVGRFFALHHPRPTTRLGWTKNCHSSKICQAFNRPTPPPDLRCKCTRSTLLPSLSSWRTSTLRQSCPRLSPAHLWLRLALPTTPFTQKGG